MPRSALLVGATGLVGSALLKLLLDSPRYARVDVWVRRALEIPHPKLTAKVVDFDRLGELRVDAEDVYCALGTTIRTAGSKGAFRRVDCDYPLALARTAARDGAQRILVVSSLGADSRSGMFYSRVKGEMEESVSEAGVPKALFFRPSLLDGRRSEFRLGERIGLLVGVVLGPLLGRYRPIHAGLVAAAMLRAAEHDLPAGVFDSERIRKLVS